MEMFVYEDIEDDEFLNYKLFQERVDSAQKLGSLSLDLSLRHLAEKVSSEDYIYLFNQLKDSNIENINLKISAMNDDELIAFSDVLKHTKIKNLNLGSNHFHIKGLSALSSALKESQVQVLNLFNNHCTDLIHIFAKSLPLSNVTSLDLGCTHMSLDCFKSFSRTLVETNITVLNFDYCLLGDKCIKFLCKKLNNLNIQNLSLIRNKMSLVSLKSLADVLENTTITKLNIHFNKFGSAGAIYLAGKLEKSILQDLDIGSNKIKSEGCSAIGNVIHLTQISKLNLEKNSIDSRGIRLLADNLKQSNVKYLNLSKNNLQINGAQILADGIEHSDLQYLNVDNNKLRNVGMGIILDALQLTKICDFHLDLYGNKMKAENMKFVTNAFKFLKLKNLKLILPRVQSDGNIVELFFNELKTLIESDEIDEILPIKNKMNLSVKFYHHPPSFDSVKHFYMKKLKFHCINLNTLVTSLLKVLVDKKNPISNITTLKLYASFIGDEGAVILAENFKYLKVTRLELNYTEIGNDGVIAIAKELKNSQIRYLNLKTNSFNSIAASYLITAVEKHPVRILLSEHIINGLPAQEQLVIENMYYMFARAQLLVSSVSENSPVKYDKNLIPYLKVYEIFKNVDLLWKSSNKGPKYDYNQVNSKIRYNVTNNFLKIMGFVNSDEIISDSLPPEMIINICSYLNINDIKFN